MKNTLHLWQGICILLAASLFSCRDATFREGLVSDKKTLSVADARLYYEASADRTRSQGDIPELPTLGAITPAWSQGAPSENDYAASVDVPLTAEYTYQVRHLLPDGSSMWFFLYPKLVVLQGIRTDGNDLYIAFYIPDPDLQQTCSENVGARYRNSLSKTGFTGRILYTTLDGIPAAAARYTDGKQTHSAFLWDFPSSKEYLDALFGTIGEIVMRRTPSDATRGINDNNMIPEVIVIARVNLAWKNIMGTIHMRTESLDHINPTTGSGGGGSGATGSGSNGKGSGSDNDGSSVNPNIVTDDSEIDELLEEIDLDCMGGALLDALDYDIGIETGAGNNRFTYEGTYSGNDLVSQSGRIEISKMEDYILLEELIHAYQNRDGRNRSGQNDLNNEIEAKVAWLLYLERKRGVGFDINDYRKALGGQKGLIAFNILMSCVEFGISFDDPAFQSSYEDAASALGNINSYSNYDESSEDRNFENLSNLMNNC